jgi:hypothetical protein
VKEARPPETVTCPLHGEGQATYVCQHIASGAARQFLADEPSADDPFPDAWCERCDELLEERGWAWDAEMMHLAHVAVMCHLCYERRRRTHQRPALDIPGDDPLLRFTYTCGECAEEHHGLPAWGADAPAYYAQVDDLARRRARLTGDTCVVDGHHFVRGCLEIPILGSHEWWSWGVWVSLSEKSYARVLELLDDPARDREPPYFGWFSTTLPRLLYPETLGLKAAVHERPPGERPLIILEPTDHPLAVDQHEGISLERAREMAALLLGESGGAVV